MKLPLPVLLAFFVWIGTLNYVFSDDEEDCVPPEGEDYCEEPSVEVPTNDYCYFPHLECQTQPNPSDCDNAIDSLCGMMKTSMYNSEPMCMPMDKPMKSNVSIRGVCHACRYGPTTNKYVNKDFRELVFGIGMPYLYIEADTLFNLMIYKKQSFMLINCTNLCIRMAFHVCDANISRSEMKQFKIQGCNKKRPTCQFGTLEKGKRMMAPKILTDPVMGIVFAIMPMIVPAVVPKKELAAVGMIGGCPMTGGPK